MKKPNIEITSRALEFYRKLKKEHNTRVALDSHKSFASVHFISKNKIEDSDGRLMKETSSHISYEMDKEYFEEFRRALLLIARKHNTCVMLRPDFNPATECYYVTGTLYTTEEFEHRFGYSVDDYYQLLTLSQEPSVEDEFRNELSKLRSYYLGHVSNNAFLCGKMGYQEYLNIASKFPTVLNKESILNEMGFKLDIENESLQFMDRVFLLTPSQKKEV